jgi:quercetin dioxygenase-like cupin family protein
MISVSKNASATVLVAALLGAAPLRAATVLENDYVRVSRDEAPCAQASTPGCAERMIVAMAEMQLGFGKVVRTMRRGEVAVFNWGESYSPPAGGPYFEVAVKPNVPPVKSPPGIVAPARDTLLFEGERFFVYEVRLAQGDTRPRHSHSQRIEIRINQGPLPLQVIDGRDAPQQPPVVSFREPVIHSVTNVGDMALWNIVLEFRPGVGSAPRK